MSGRAAGTRRPRCRSMRLVDDTGRLIRAPEVRFSCDEIGLDAFGYNIENRMLVEALEERAAELPDLTRFDDEAEAVDPGEADVRDPHRTGQIAVSARLVVGADGRQSLCREAAGIEVRRRALDQAAVTFNVVSFAAAPQYLDRISYRRRVRAYSCRCPATAPAWSGSRTPARPSG